MTDMLQPNPFNFPLPPATPFMAPKHPYILPVTLSLVVATIIAASGYLYFYGFAPAQVAVVESVPTEADVASPVGDTTTLPAIPTLTTPTIWSTPIASSLVDAQGQEVFGTIIGTPPIDKNDSTILSLLSETSPLITQYGWIMSTSDSSAEQDLFVFQKGSQKLYIQYFYNSYLALLAE